MNRTTTQGHFLPASISLSHAYKKYKKQKTKFIYELEMEV